MKYGAAVLGTRRASSVFVGMVLVALCEGSEGSDTTDDGVPENVAAYFSGGAFCSVAKIRSIAIEHRNIVVILDTDRRWASTLAKKPNIRDRWISIHCPPLGVGVWESLAPDQQIVIDTNLDGEGRYRMNCDKKPY